MGILDRLTKKMKENLGPQPVSEESAEAQLLLFVEYYDIDLENIKQNKQSEEVLEANYKSIVKRIRLGVISIEPGEDGAPIVKQKMKNGDLYEYGEPTAESTIAKTKYKDEDNKMLSVLGSLCGHKMDDMRKLRGADRMAAFRIGSLFLPVV